MGGFELRKPSVGDMDMYGYFLEHMQCKIAHLCLVEDSCLFHMAVFP